MTDSLTGLFNRRGWDSLLAAEEDRCSRYGHPAGIVVIDLDDLKKKNDEEGHGSGDLLLQETALILRENLRNADIVARIGGDEFSVLAVECNRLIANNMVERLSNALDSKGIAASVGFGFREPTGTLFDAFDVADKAMYERKRDRKQTLAVVD
ncbi:MAG: GGDEF domain-containing protein [Aeoliella sp.]